ncbi:hypothetical protein JXI42_00585 [bacterium]|nr:hypothetical protein [bacterium]
MVLHGVDGNAIGINRRSQGEGLSIQALELETDDTITLKMLFAFKSDRDAINLKIA